MWLDQARGLNGSSESVLRRGGECRRRVVAHQPTQVTATTTTVGTVTDVLIGAVSMASSAAVKGVNFACRG